MLLHGKSTIYRINATWTVVQFHISTYCFKWPPSLLNEFQVSSKQKIQSIPLNANHITHKSKKSESCMYELNTMDLILILWRAPTMKIYASPWVEHNLSYKCNVNSWTQKVFPTLILLKVIRYTMISFKAINHF